jgi:hypothetical protein
MHDTDLIDTQELKAKLDRGDSFKVVMTLGEWEYRTIHPWLDVGQHRSGSARGARPQR